MNDSMSWIDEQEKKNAEEKSKDYFNVVEGDNRFQLLTHIAPYPVKWTGTKYEPAKEGDTDASIKGVCWVLQDGEIKSANLPYTAVKQIRELMQDPDYTFDSFPMPRLVNLKAKGAGTKEVDYLVVPSPKETPVSEEILAKLANKPTPEEMVEKLKGKGAVASGSPTYEEVDPSQIPF